MLSSIHPLGERSRSNRWGLTVGAFTVASMVVAGTVGAVLGAIGSVIEITSSTALLVTGGGALAAGILDILRVAPPGPERQVNEHWIGAFRGWVYGAGFGAQLGSGVMTFVVTWGVYATFLAEAMSQSWLAGALIGAVFGFGRSVSLLAARVIRDPSSLSSFHERMARYGRPVRLFASSATAALGILVVAGGLL